MMNMKTPQLILALALVASLKVAPSVAGKGDSQIQSAHRDVEEHCPTRAALKCAGLVSKAEAADRDSTTISVVQARWKSIRPPRLP